MSNNLKEINIKLFKEIEKKVSFNEENELDTLQENLSKESEDRLDDYFYTVSKKN